MPPPPLLLLQCSIATSAAMLNKWCEASEFQERERRLLLVAVQHSHTTVSPVQRLRLLSAAERHVQPGERHEDLPAE
jgi:hypothetical protein